MCKSVLYNNILQSAHLVGLFRTVASSSSNPMKMKSLLSAAVLLLLALGSTAAAQSVHLRIDPKANNYYLVDRHSNPIGGAVTKERFMSGDQVYFYGVGEYHILRSVNDSAAVVHVIYADNSHYGFWTLKPQFQSITPVTPFNRYGLFIAFDGEAYSVWNHEGMEYVSPQYSSITCSPSGLLTLVSKYDGSVDTLHCDSLLAKGALLMTIIETDCNVSAEMDTIIFFDPDVTMSDTIGGDIQDDDVVFITPESGAEFPGGYEAWLKFFSDNLRYPQDARDKGISGTAVVHVVVEIDGSLTNARMVRSLCKSIDEECLRLVSIMPRFIPGKWYDKPVRTEMTIPIIFKP